MKKLPANFPVALSACAVPSGFNLAMNRYPFPVRCHSDTTDINVWFYEYHGLYWFGFQVYGRIANSVPYASVRNCISGFRFFLRNMGFSFDDPDLAESRLVELRARPSFRSVSPSKSRKA